MREMQSAAGNGGGLAIQVAQEHRQQAGSYKTGRIELKLL
jgi:hypothetical protein